MLFIEGILKIANVLLAIIAGILAITLFKVSNKKFYLRPWKILIGVLILFGIQEILGALRAFRIYSTPHLTHIVPTAMLGLLIWALTAQIIINKGNIK